MSKIISLKAENFKRLTAVSIRPDGSYQEIRGLNAQGKSSVLDAIEWAIGGAKHCPAEPIRSGQEETRVILETEEHKITRRRSAEGRDQILVESKTDKSRITSPQAFLDTFLGATQFDPMAFTRMAPKEQASLLRKVVGLDTSALDAERAQVFSQRTGVNREVDTLRKKLDGLDEPTPAPEPEAEKDATELLWKMEQATKAQAKNDAARRELVALRGQLERKIDEMLRLQTEVTDMRAKLETGTEHVATLQDPDLDAIRAEAEQAKAHNARVRAQRQRKAEVDRRIDEYARLRGNLTDAERLAKHHTARLAEIDAEKARLLAEASFPLPGLGLTENGVTLNGIPFEQASSREKIMTGFGIAFETAGSLRAVLCRDGSLLDQPTRAALAPLAKAKGVQIWLEVVGDGPGGIVIEDGAVRQDDEPEPRELCEAGEFTGDRVPPY